MLGSITTCPYCGSPELRRNVLNKTTQCMKCLAVLEERMHDLMEFSAKTEMEEIHCAVTADFINRAVSDIEIPEDPYTTKGFITAFRMLAPMRESVCGTTARTVHGALAEMERQIGDSLYGGYVGYNGRQPGASKELKLEKQDEEKQTSGDARHTLVAYFQIHELASMCGVDKETADLGVRCFRHAASRTSLRNRNVESMATAALVCALERARLAYAEAKLNDPEAENLVEPTATMKLVSEVSTIPLREIERYLRLINNALQKQAGESSASVVIHMPQFAAVLELSEDVRNLALSIAEKVIENNICARRNPVSISAAAIYMACQLEDAKKTQTEICQKTGLTEVTLRKVYKEIIRHVALVVPPHYADRIDTKKLSMGATLPGKEEFEEEEEEEQEEENEDEGTDFGDMFPPGVTVAPFGGTSFVPPPPPPLLPKHAVQPDPNKVDPPDTVSAKAALADLFMQFARSGMFPHGTGGVDISGAVAAFMGPSPSGGGGVMPPLPPPLPDLQSGVPNLQDSDTAIAMDIAKESS